MAHEPRSARSERSLSPGQGLGEGSRLGRLICREPLDGLAGRHYPCRRMPVRLSFLPVGKHGKGVRIVRAETKPWWVWWSSSQVLSVSVKH